MPTDLAVIERRLEETLRSVADQTDVDGPGPARLSPAGDRRRRPHRVWLAAGVAAALLIGVVVVVGVRDRNSTDVTAGSTTTTADGAAGPLPLVVATYLPAGMTGWTEAPNGGVTPGATATRGPVTIAGRTDDDGLTVTWLDGRGGSMMLQLSNQPMSDLYPPDSWTSAVSAFDGHDGLRFAFDTQQNDSVVAALQAQEDDLKDQYTKVFNEAVTAPREQQDFLKAQKDSLIDQAKNLEDQIATAKKAPRGIRGGKAGVSLRLGGTVDAAQLQAVAVGLHVVPGGTIPQLPSSPSGSDAPATTASSTAGSADEPAGASTTVAAGPTISGMPLVVATYLPPGMTGWTLGDDGLIVTAPDATNIGQVSWSPAKYGNPPPRYIDVRWQDADHRSMTMRMSETPAPAVPGTRLDGRDGLRFGVDDATALKLQPYNDQLTAYISQFALLYDTLQGDVSPDDRALLKSREDAVNEQAKELDAQMAGVGHYVVAGGRDDVFIQLAGTVSIDELRKVAAGLHVVPGRPAFGADEDPPLKSLATTSTTSTTPTTAMTTPSPGQPG
jgi:hypothetical protein